MIRAEQSAAADRAAITVFRDIAPKKAARLLSFGVRRGGVSMDEAEMRADIRAALQLLNTDAERAIRRELAAPLDLGHSGRLQFEVCPYFFGIHLVQTEECILEDSVVLDAMPPQLREAAEAADLDLYTALGEELFPWFAKRWLAADGPKHFRPAYAFFHGGLDEPRYDLEQRCWYSVEEVWPEEA